MTSDDLDTMKNYDQRVTAVSPIPNTSDIDIRVLHVKIPKIINFAKYCEILHKKIVC